MLEPARLREALHALDFEFCQGQPPAPGRVHAVKCVGETLVFPYRVYYSRDQIDLVTQRLSGDEAVLAVCLVSRHHNGYIREAAIRDSHFCDRPWSVPFAVQLLGEYVVEVGQAVEDRIRSFGLESFIGFASENPDFMRVTRHRAISYWNCYYRGVYPNLLDYPSYRALQAICAEAGDA